MIYIGNYKDWIDDKWISEVLTDNNPLPLYSEGTKSLLKLDEVKKLQGEGFDTDKIMWWQYTHTNVSFDIKPPFIDSLYHWWIIKLMPGNFLPMHVDPCGKLKNSNRYWVALHDWAPGHIFMYEDTVITNYKAGDVWRFENPMALHGSANIGPTPRVVLQVTTYDE